MDKLRYRYSYITLKGRGGSIDKLKYLGCFLRERRGYE